MCSILGIFGDGLQTDLPRAEALNLSKLQRHRGPDWSGIFADEKAVLVHERLAIVDVTHGAQPIISADGRFVLAVNGEIYNYRALRSEIPEYDYQTGSDCEVIVPLYLRYGADCVQKLNGIFAFILYDSVEKSYVVARDPVGVVPLYYGTDNAERVYFSSEMKAIESSCTQIQIFKPGHILVSAKDQRHRSYVSRVWRSYDDVMSSVESGSHADKVGADTLGESIGTTLEEGVSTIRKGLSEAVHRQLISDVPFGVLLSGGLDSSIIAALVCHFAERRVEDDDRSASWWPRIHSFAIGLADSPDLKAAEVVAAHIGSVHHGFTFTIQEGLDALSDVVYYVETYDTTTIRASTPMYLMARKIKAMGVKMVLSGEGADEIFGGYLYFHRAPDARSFHDETIRKIDRLHLFDCARANKSMAAWGIEARVPFLDLEFLNLAMSLDPESKMVRNGRLEKQILRDAFRDLLPPVVLDRQKEQFSDGVGYRWIDELKNHTERIVSDAEFAQAEVRFPVNTPDTKEGYFYRSLFESHFPGESAARTVPEGKSIACSTPEALEWDETFGSTADPSGRAMRGVHVHSYQR